MVSAIGAEIFSYKDLLPDKLSYQRITILRLPIM